VQFFRDYDMLQDDKFLMLFPADVDDPRDVEQPQIAFVLNWFEELKRLVPAR
jgi:hypothetical protein